MKFYSLESGFSVKNVEINAYCSDPRAHRYLYLIAGVHGDEIEGVHVLREYFSWLKKDDFKRKDIPLVVIPKLNVDGLNEGLRGNARSVDLNRNLKSECWETHYDEKKFYPGPYPNSEPENKFLIKLFDNYRPGLIISFHAWKPMLNFNGRCKKVAELISEYNKYPVKSSVGYETPGSLGEFAPSCYSCPVLTYECPKHDDNRSLTQIWEENEEGLKKFINSDIIKSYMSEEFVPLSDM